MDIQALIAAKQKDMAAKKSRQNTLKPQPGKHTYRILPSWKGAEGQFWHDFAMHFVKTQESGQKPAAIYLCTEKTYGRPCEICDAIQKSISVCSDDKMVELLKSAKAGQRYLLNVLHTSGPEPEKVQILEVGGGVFEAICELIMEYGDITDPEKGIDVVIKREGSGLDTSYTVLPAAKSQPVKASLLQNLPNLDDYVAQENPAGQVKALTAVGQIIGIEAPAAGTPGLPTGNRPALADLSDVDDADYEPVGATASVDEADLDELDELLEG